MDLNRFFLERYEVLTTRLIAGIWKAVPPDSMRQRPDPRVNSIVWNLWHITRVEDAGLNRFIVDRAQVLDEGQWLPRLNIPWRHQGTDMTFPEVDDLSQRINVQALHDYSLAIQARTVDIVNQLHPMDLDAVMEVDRLRVILLDEGLAHPSAAGLVQNYTGWNKGRCLIAFGLTHPFQHVGEMGVIASLLGLEM